MSTVLVGYLLRILSGHTDDVHSICLMTDDVTLVSGSWDTTVRLWDIDTGACPIQCQYIAVALTSLLTCTSGEQKDCLRGHSGHVTSVCVMADRNRIISGSTDHTVGVWLIQNAGVYMFMYVCTCDISASRPTHKMLLS